MLAIEDTGSEERSSFWKLELDIQSTYNMHISNR